MLVKMALKFAVTVVEYSALRKSIHIKQAIKTTQEINVCKALAPFKK